MTSLIRYKPRKATTRIILHDSHTDPSVVGTADVPRWSALARRGALEMGLLDTGYHYIIERDGKVSEGRSRHLIGTHTPGHNMDSIGICLVGGRSKNSHIGEDNFTALQWHSLFLLIIDLSCEYGHLDVYSHTEIQKYRNKSLPDCPPVDMDDVRQELALFKLDWRNVYDKPAT